MKLYETFYNGSENHYSTANGFFNNKEEAINWGFRNLNLPAENDAQLVNARSDFRIVVRKNEIVVTNDVTTEGWLMSAFKAFIEKDEETGNHSIVFSLRENRIDGNTLKEIQVLNLHSNAKLKTSKIEFEASVYINFFVEVKNCISNTLFIIN